MYESSLNISEVAMSGFSHVSVQTTTSGLVWLSTCWKSGILLFIERQFMFKMLILSAFICEGFGVFLVVLGVDVAFGFLVFEFGVLSSMEDPIEVFWLWLIMTDGESGAWSFSKHAKLFVSDREFSDSNRVVA